MGCFEETKSTCHDPIYNLNLNAILTFITDVQSQLQDIAKEAYGDDAPDTISLWGVDIDTNGTPNARASVALMKFLRARYGCP